MEIRTPFASVGIAAIAFLLTVGAARPVAAESVTFTLAHDGKTSAGVFAADGTLVKTLWSGASFRAGSYTREWDGTTDEGGLAPAGTYEIRVLSSQAKYTWEGVIGNTSTASTGASVFNYMSTISGMATTGGTAYIATGYNEQNTTQGRFSLSTPGAKTDIGTKGSTFYKVATDGTNVYWAARDTGVDQGFVAATVHGTDAPAGTVNYTSNGGSSYFVVDFVQDAPPPAPDGGVGDGGTDAGAWDAGGPVDAMISGLAVQKTHPFLFVARKGMNSLRVVNKTTGVTISDQPFTAPGELAVDDNDDLWMIHTSGGNRVVQRFDVDDTTGELTPGVVITGLEKPLALASNGTLLVIDGGDSQQVKAFDGDGDPLWTYGQAGGYTNSPAVANDKFDFEPNLGEYSNDPFLAFQSDGSFWVGDPGCYRVQHFSSSRVFIDRISYVTTHYSAAVDVNDSKRVFADFLEFEVDYDLPLGPANGSWELVRNWRKALGENDNVYGRMKYVTTLDGCHKDGGKCTYAVIGTKLYELVPATGLRDTGKVLETTESGTVSFASLASDGSVYEARFALNSCPPQQTWEHRELIGFDGSDNPSWTTGGTLASVPFGLRDPAIGGDGNTIRPGVITSSGVLVSFDPENTWPWCGTHTGGWHLGGVKVSDDGHWLWKASPSTPANYKGGWPDDGTFDVANGVMLAGGVAMAVDRHIIYGYPGENWHGIQTNKWRHYYDDGLLVAEFGKTYFEDGTGAASAELAGNAWNSSLIKRSNGNVYLYHNDESHHGGLHRWLIEDLDTVDEAKTTVYWRPDFQPGLLGESFDTPDWNSANRTSTRLTPEIDFDWGATAAFSARWSGYVLPQYSETYTFEVESDDWARLWVGGTKILEGGGVKTGTVALSAGVHAPIRLEYRHGSSDASITLKWSSSSVTSEIIPTERLASRSPGVNLMSGMSSSSDPPSSGPLASSIAGWTRSPEEDETEEFHYWTVTNELDGDNPYLSVSYQETTPGVKTVTRDLGPVDGNASRWEINTMMNWWYVNHDPYCGQRVEILDDAGKVVANFYATMVSYPDEARILGNGIVVHQSDVETTEAILQERLPLRITGENGQIRFDYAGYEPVVAPLVDLTANWRRIKTLRLYYWTTSSFCGYTSSIQLDGLHLSTTKASGREDNLLAGLAPTGTLTSGTAGWTRNPTTDDSDWTVGTEVDASGSHLALMHRDSAPGVATVTRDLSVPSDTTRRWQLGMKVKWTGIPDPCSGQRIEVLDDTDKVVAEFYATPVSASSDARIYANGDILRQSLLTTMASEMETWQPLDISAANGRITFRYGEYTPVTTSMADPTADWRRIKTLRLYYWTSSSSCTDKSELALRDLRLDTSSAGTAVDLLEGLPPATAMINSGEYGWTYTPSHQTWWDASTNLMSWQTTGSVDLGFEYGLAGGTSGAEATASRDLGTPSSDTQRWQLSGLIRMDLGNADGHGSQYIDVLDDAGKIIARLNKDVNDIPGHIHVNEEAIPNYSEAWWTKAWSSLDISAEAGEVTFRYGNTQPITKAIFDEEAAWQRPKTLRISYATAPYISSFSSRVYFDELKFMATKAWSTDVPTVSTNAATYAPSASIGVAYSSLPGNSTDWLAVAVAGAPAGSYISWVYTSGTQHGTATLTAPSSAGSYVVRAFPNNTYTIIAETPFTVSSP